MNKQIANGSRGPRTEISAAREMYRERTKQLRRDPANNTPQNRALVRKLMLAQRRVEKLQRRGRFVYIHKGKAVDVNMSDKERAYCARGLQVTSQECQRRRGAAA